MQGSRRTLVPGVTGLALGALALLPSAALADGLTPASPASPGTDDTQFAYIVIGVLATVIALAAIVALLAAARGRRRIEQQQPARTRGSSGLQRRVGIGLGLFATAVFVFGIVVTESAREVEPTGANGLRTAQRDISVPAGADPLEIEVTGQQWLWRYQYPDGTFSYYELVVPVDTAVVLNIGSIDVLHSWSVPALTGTFEVAPGAGNTTWFRAQETGVYEGRSTQFSGDGYATMRAAVRVVEPGQYEAWLSDQAAGIQAARDAVQERVDDGTAPGVELG